MAYKLPVQIGIIIITHKLVQGKVATGWLGVLLAKQYTPQMSMALFLIQ